MARRRTAQEIAHLVVASDSEDEAIDDAGPSGHISEEEIDILEEAEEEEEEEDEEEEYDCSTSESDTNTRDSGTFVGKDGTIWSSIPPHTAAYRQHNVIHVRPGLTHAVRNIDEHVDFFSTLISPSMIRHICTCTNKRLPDDVLEVTDNEIESYIGILILLGVTKKRNVDIDQIWSPSSMHYLEYVSLVMSRSRFQIISRYLTFDDVNERTTTMSKFHKMQYIFSEFQRKISTAFEPHTHVCVDETLYAFRGNCSFRQYMQKKPAKYGIKYFCMCDVTTSYLCNVQVYLGKDTNQPQRNKNIGMNVVLKLAEPIEKTGRGITTDSYFTSIPLADKLWDKKLTLVGTMNKNKTAIPHQFQANRNRPIQDCNFGFNREKTLISFVPRKNKVVHLLSTEHHHRSIARQEDGDNKPEAILAYNSTKGAVDSFDKLVVQYSCRRQTRRWTMNVFFFIIDAAAYNSFVMYHMRKPEIMSTKPKVQRRIHLEKLGKALCEPQIRDRVETWQQKQMRGIPIQLQDIARRNGALGKIETCLPSRPLPSKGRCEFCKRNMDRKTKNRCGICKKLTCKDHAAPDTVICEQCADF